MLVEITDKVLVNVGPAAEVTETVILERQVFRNANLCARDAIDCSRQIIVKIESMWNRPNS